ncbi:hypothetical protein C5167_005069 [Papaver somniferum]|uniref:Large ribosomal subunit protein bL25 beta domain-containing protein n=1 Tax=Papaver somniferum TaxID=3469 RepID=A0A4Y7JD89_PAPSO|nr:hypothetical protein C5167_005069 [Papaver somniferum]
MALQLRSRFRPIQNPNLIKLFSSESNNNGDKVPSSSSSSLFSDVKESLQQPSSSPPRRNTLNDSPPPPPSSAPKLDEIRKNLSEFRRRSSVPPQPTASFQDLYKRNVPEKTDENKQGNVSINSIRESLRNIRKISEKPNARPNNSFKSFVNQETNQSNAALGGGSELPSDIFGGKEIKEKSEAEMEAMKTEFLNPYSHEELGRKLRQLRPDETTKKEFTVHGLNERLKKLRVMEEQVVDKVGGLPLKSLKESLLKLKLDSDEKSRMQMDNISIFGGYWNQYTGPAKELLVEKAMSSECDCNTQMVVTVTSEVMCMLELYFHPDNMSSEEKMKLELKKVRDEFKISESDCGSSHVQVAQLTTKIKHLSSVLHKKVEMLDYRRNRLGLDPVVWNNISSFSSREDSGSLEFRRVMCEGIFDESKSIYVGPRSRSISEVTENGYYVITPLVPNSSDPKSVQSPVLVNRGWDPRSWREKHQKDSQNVETVSNIKIVDDGETEGSSRWKFWSKKPIAKTFEDPVISSTLSVKVIGVIRGSEKPSIFVPANDPSSGQWFYVDVPARAADCLRILFILKISMTMLIMDIAAGAVKKRRPATKKPYSRVNGSYILVPVLLAAAAVLHQEPEIVVTPKPQLYTYLDDLPKPNPKYSETIIAIPRTDSGKNIAAKERRDGRVPSIVFEQEKGEEGVKSDFESDEIIEKVRVLPRQLHLDAGTDAVLNVTFLRAPSNALLKIDVPLVFIGEDVSPGLRKGAYLNTMRRHVKYLCPADIVPPYIEVDLSELDVGKKIIAKDLKVHPALKLLVQEDEPICKIKGARMEQKKGNK